MIELAQTQFIFNSSWPNLNELVTKKFVTYIDYALARYLLKKIPEASEDLAAFICYLSLSSRLGHLCILIKNLSIFPPASELLVDSEKEEGFCTISLEAIAKKMTAMILTGARQLPNELIQRCDNKSSGSVTTPICHYEDYFYFQRHWKEECILLENFIRVTQGKPQITLPFNIIDTKVLLPKQAEAVLHAVQNSFSIICGGPGTGKTHTAGHVILTLWDSLSQEQKLKTEFLLTAPTGKAAANLQASISRSTSHLTDFKPLVGKTLHAVLELHKSVSPFENHQKTLSADVIIVDECSMIDVTMMASLFSAIKDGARLILLGDQNQLSSVEAGRVFADLISSCRIRYPKNIHELEVCLRTDLVEIVEFASAIKNKEVLKALAILKQSQVVSLLHFPEGIIRETQQAIVDYAIRMISKHWQSNPLAFLEKLKAFILLSPLRRGPYGVEELNRQISYQFLKKQQPNAPFFIPIMIVRNDYRLGLFNGDVGVLVVHTHQIESKKLQLSQNDYALFPQKSHSEQSQRIPALLLPTYEYAFCLSVYKSQGSEFDHVFLVMPEGAENFGKEMFYTAATRARKRLEIWGSEVTLTKTILESTRRLSGITERLTKGLDIEKV